MPAILAKSPDGMSARAVLYSDTGGRPKLLAVATEAEFAEKFPAWHLFEVHVTEHQFTRLENFRLKREGATQPAA